MYQTYYRLRADPFRLSPDHAFCYRYPSFAKGRAYMQYALQAAEGFVVVTGAPGMGKTTLINDLLADYGTSDYLVARLVNTMLEANDILRSTAYEFGLNVEGVDNATVVQHLKQLFTRSYQNGRPPLLVVDEAQNLSLDALEELRLLTNLQIEGRPLLQIFLVGQEGLRDKLADPRLEQLRQRVTAAAHLHPLTQEQTAAYILHRLKVVGWDNFPRIKASVLPVIEAACQGVPRRINQFCSRLLLHGAVEEKSVLNAQDATAVFNELSDERLSSSPASVSSSPDSAFLDDPDSESVETAQPGPAVGAVTEPVFAEAENLLREQKRVVVPPPRPARVRSSDSQLVPSLEETFAPPPRFRPDSSPPPPIAPMPGPGVHPYPRRPEPRGAGIGVGLLLLLLVGGGVYAWYHYDRGGLLDLVGPDFEPLLGEPAASEPFEPVVVEPRATTSGDTPATQGKAEIQPGAAVTRP
jgi:type II secretory pathway predicted ATPase ExeA